MSNFPIQFQVVAVVEIHVIGGMVKSYLRIHSFRSHFDCKQHISIYILFPCSVCFSINCTQLNRFNYFDCNFRLIVTVILGRIENILHFGLTWAAALEYRNLVVSVGFFAAVDSSVPNIDTEKKNMKSENHMFRFPETRIFWHSLQHDVVNRNLCTM